MASFVVGVRSLVAPLHWNTERSFYFVAACVCVNFALLALCVCFATVAVTLVIKFVLVVHAAAFLI
jgi:hypothetical protein